MPSTLPFTISGPSYSNTRNGREAAVVPDRERTGNKAVRVRVPVSAPLGNPPSSLPVPVLRSSSSGSRTSSSVAVSVVWWLVFEAPELKTSYYSHRQGWNQDQRDPNAISVSRSSDRSWYPCYSRWARQPW